ncbi:flavodoxin family protein [Motiliproteus sediminis]|uniref:flavodoxin family protein n=1 Tax=Motiliproteus sediminis TaxID=1468178 RepID=UPI001AEF5C31|nr:flavodoxin family protein [Motiliproteus sediminis]
MTKLVVVYHSGYGHTQKQAEAVRAGMASVADSDAELMPIDEAGELSDDNWETLAAADAIVFGSPTYMGSVSWQFKKFADASSKIWFEQGWKDKLAAGFTNSASMNGDKLSTLHYLFTLAMQHSMVWASAGMMPANSLAADRNDINYLGAYCGLMAQSPSDADTSQGPLPGDLATARQFGERIAQLAKRWRC